MKLSPKKLTATFKKFLLIAFIGILALNIASAAKTLFQQQNQPIEIPTIQAHEQIDKEAAYIISEKAVYSHLQAKSQIVSLQQEVHKEATHVDDKLLGERHTSLELNGTLKMGLETKDIKIIHIDSKSGIVYVKLPQPIIISLDIPYDQVDFEKAKGWARFAMNEEEKKTFYKAEDKKLEQELVKDKELMRQADVFNRDAVMGLFSSFPEVKSVVFE